MAVRRYGRTYYADYYNAEGQRVRKSLGTQHKGTAEKRYRELRAEDAPAPEPGMRFDQLVDRWLHWKEHECDAPMKPRSLHFLRITARTFIREFGDLDANGVPQERIDQWKARRRREVTPQTLNNQLHALNNLFRFALEDELIQSAPKVTRIRVKTKRVPKELNRAQLDALFAAARGERLEVVIRLALYAGLRADECCWLTWGDVDLDHGLVHITAKEGWSPKSSSERSVPIPSGLIEWLKGWMERLPFSRPSDWVCQRDPTVGIQWQRVYLGQCVKELFQRAGIELPRGTRHKLHLLRGTYATTCLRGGADLESLRANLGHTDVKVTAMYLNATDASRRRAVAGLDELLPS